MPLGRSLALGTDERLATEFVLKILHGCILGHTLGFDQFVRLGLHVLHPLGHELHQLHVSLFIHMHRLVDNATFLVESLEPQKKGCEMLRLRRIGDRQQQAVLLSLVLSSDSCLVLLPVVLAEVQRQPRLCVQVPVV